MSRRRPHVLMTADAVGGVWTYALDLGGGLVDSGAAVTLAVLGPAPDADQSRAATAAGLMVEPLGGALDWTAAHEGEVAASAARLSQLCAKLRPDLLQLNSPALAAFSPFPVPVLAACHSCVKTWWIAVEGDAPLPDDLAWRAALVEFGYAKAAALVAPSRAFAKATQAAYGLGAPPHVVTNGRARPPTFPAQDERALVFTAGRLWDKGKDVATLDSALDRAGLPGEAAGPLTGPNGQAAAFRRLTVLGRLCGAGVQARLAARPIFVSPSRYEPFGLAVLEAAQQGCPLVLADIATFRELWDGAAAFFPPGDVAALAATLSDLAADPDRRDQLGQAAYARAGRYTLGAMTDATLRLYATLSPVFAGREAAA